MVVILLFINNKIDITNNKDFEILFLTAIFDFRFLIGKLLKFSILNSK